ncbi:energy-coupling factor transport system permease protein [Propionibacterium cyclohexanicum]|uniref:Energy-coupling factor transport system permease protein n=1 Tax=Propionibacterium cyclohexanicum TaxID=64702 RepID=A0A1H9RV86_9ACTN|nr:energy-coupling factor transporter transmembrane component T [Propionibacterium cyclohexanicum]SER76355.1 energy-coupling factor transport system permease protein [Propionibacterium cyclohexanicum]
MTTLDISDRTALAGQHSATRATRLDRLNPVTRFLLLVLAALPVIISLDWLSAAVMFVGTVLILRACGVPVRRLARRLRPVLLVAPLAAVSMALYGKPGGEVYWHWGLIWVTQRSVTMAIAVVVRILALGVAAVELLGGLDLTATADGLAQICRLPARFVLGALAGLRLAGLFVDDWRTLAQARRARGLGDSGRLRRFATMAFALLVFAIRRGTKLATAMEARGFSSQTAGRRTWARVSRLGLPDAIGWVITAALAALAIGSSLYFGTFSLVTR